MKHVAIVAASVVVALSLASGMVFAFQSPVFLPLIVAGPTATFTPTATATATVTATATKWPEVATPTRTPTATGAPVVNGKKGGGMSTGSQAADLPLLGVSWCHNWGPTVHNCAGYDFIIYLWNLQTVENFVSGLYPIPAEAIAIAPLTEPNRSDMANCPIGAACANRLVELWPELRRIADDNGLLLVSPIPAWCSPSNDPACLDGYWLDRFAPLVGTDWDLTGLNAYGCSAIYMEAYIHQRHTQFNRPILIGEYAAPNWCGVSLTQFMRDTMAWLDAQPWVVGYAWFPMRDPGNAWWSPYFDPLVDNTGQMTLLGREYSAH